MRTIEIEGQLRERLFQELGDPGQVFLDGQIHRFKGDGDKSQNAWYVCHPEGYGAFGSWRLGYTAKFKADGINTRSNEMRDLMERRAFEAAIEKNRKRAAAKERAIEMWRQSKDVDSNHPYIQAKFNGELPPKLSCTQLGATLLIPMFDLEEETGVVANLQRIDQTGQKKFLYGGQVIGTGLKMMHSVHPPAHPINICEGWATGVTLYNSGRNVVIAWNTGNLGTVARIIRKQEPGRTIYIAADNDQWSNETNPGLEAATKAGIAIDAGVIYPDFTGLDTSSCPTDFNDYQNLGGQL